MGDRGGLTTAQLEWARCRPWIEAALARSPGFEDIEDVERLVMEGQYIFFSGPDCAAICSIEVYCQKKAFVIQHAGGDPEGSIREMIADLDPSMCAYANAMGCDMIMERGREGWKPILEKHGYRVGYVAMVKELRQ
jgi:hypothetical protein